MSLLLGWRAFEKVVETVKYLYGYRCAICDKSKFLTIHHLKPRWKAGENWEVWNLAPLCEKCHAEIQPTIDTPKSKKRSWTNLLWHGQAHPSPFYKLSKSKVKALDVTWNLTLEPQIRLNV